MFSFWRSPYPPSRRHVNPHCEMRVVWWYQSRENLHQDDVRKSSKPLSVLAALLSLLIGRWGVGNHNQAGNLAIANRKGILQDQVPRRQIGFVIRTVVGAPDDLVPRVLDHVAHLDGHRIPDDLFRDPPPDALHAPELSV